MKILILLLLLFFSYTNGLMAQIKVGADGMTVKAGATVVINQLLLQPDQDLDIQNNRLETSSTPLPGDPKASIARVYRLEQPITFEGLIGIYCLPSELNGNDFNLLELVYSPTLAPNHFVVSSTSSTSATDQLVYESLGSITLQQLTAVEKGSTLPLDLLLFRATKQNNTVEVNWTIADEFNIAYYQIERSTDGSNFTAIGEVQPRCNGCGINTTYQFVDQGPQSGLNYYRLQMISSDGTHQYSEVISLQMGTVTRSIKVAPNPATGRTVITGLEAGEVYDITVYDLTGKQVYRTRSQNKERVELHLGSWAAGVYYIQLRTGSGVVQRLQLIKK